MSSLDCAASSGNGQLRLAIYGKGGIGKSTIAANLSAAFADMGLKVMQIGCDPKHDSTRLLLGGKKVETVLEFLENPSNQSGWFALRRNALSDDNTVEKVVAAGQGLPEGLTKEKILHEGYGGVLCVEAGGPVPGIGCAGRGILSTFELIEKLEVDMSAYDVILYDVLGDVVCGGFAVPLRDPYANRVLLVTSEEYMPIYAANNILRGVGNYNRANERLAGLFLNRRANDAPTDLVDRFVEVSGLPVIADMPRSRYIQEAEKLEQTVVQAFPDTDEVETFRQLATHLHRNNGSYCANPVTDEQLEEVVLGRTLADVKTAAEAPITEGVRSESDKPTGEPLRIAIYGKGGIGKSTIAANLSSAFALKGKRVLQIGCDPKHDSTRLVLGGRSVKTVLEYLQDVDPRNHKLEDVVHTGIHGITCIEVGGPEPGVGCAGRGILSAFTLLEKLGFEEDRYDVIVYDVLGDIVCGGFAIPLRSDFARAVLLVSSEEFMPIYAANNILGGINNVSGLSNRVFGIFHNVRDNEASTQTIDAFAEAVGLPVVSRLARTPRIQEAEAAGRPVQAVFPDSTEARVFADLAEALLDDPALHVPMPLLDDNLERVVIHGQPPVYKERDADQAGRDDESDAGLGSTTFTRAVDLKFTNIEAPPTDPFYYRKKPIRPPVMECAFHGAVLLALKLRDAYVVAHSPESCTHMRRLEACGMSSEMFRRRKGFYPDPMVPNLVCTNMKERELIYGGTDALTETLKEVLAKRPPVVFIVTTCAPAIIGDNYAEAIRNAQPVSPDTKIVLLRSDGNLTGGGLNGTLSALFDGFLPLGKGPGPTKEKCVNLVMDWEYEDSQSVEQILRRIGISINARFSDGYRDATVADIRKLHEAPLTLLCARNFLTEIIRKYMQESHRSVIARHSFPRGFRETELWLREIGEFFGIEKRVEEVIAEERATYEAAMAPCRSVLAGKRLALFTRGRPVDEIVDAALDTGMEVVLIGIMERKESSLFRTRHEGAVPVRFGVRPDDRIPIIREEKVDAVYTMTRHDLPPEVVFLDTVGGYHTGFGACVKLAERWVRLFQAPLQEGWKKDFPELCPVGPPSFGNMRRRR